MQNLKSKRGIGIPWLLIIVFLLFISGTVAVGIYYYQYQKQRIFFEQSEDLATISHLKVKEISQWFKERQGDGGTIRLNGPLLNDIWSFLYSNDSGGSGERIKLLMKGMTEMYDYSNVLIIDSLYNVRLTLNKNDSTAGKFIENMITRSFMNDEVIITDLHTSECVREIHLDIIVPLRLGKYDSRAFGGVIIRADPYKTLYPLIQDWPTASKTSETLIVRADGDSVLFLNEVRHRPGTALSLKLPSADFLLPAARAVQGDTGIIEGIDYRGVMVTGYISRIPEMGWYMIAKTDKEELSIPVKRYLTIAVVMIVLLISAVAVIFSFWVWNLQIRFYKERLDAEMDKAALKKHFELLVRFANDVFILLDEKRMIKEMNEKGLNEYGYDPTGVTGMKYSALSSETEFENSAGYLDRTMTDGALIYETIHKRKNGSEFPVEISSRIFDIEGKKHYQLIVRDISERKRAEKLLRDNEKRLRSVLDTMLEGCQIIGFDWTYLYINETAEKHNRRPGSELLGRKYYDMWPGIRSTSVFRILERCIEKGETGHLENEFVFPDGSSGWFELRIQQISEGILILSDDITVRKQNEEAARNLNVELEKRVKERTEQLEQANHELEAFSYSVSHDLRAPLRSVHSFTKILLEEYSPALDDEGKRICSIISDSAVQMGGLIDDLLNFSRIGRSSLNPVQIDMKLLAASVFTELTSDKDKAGISFEIEALPKATGDYNLLRLVWMNLISNAIKYSSKAKFPVIRIGSLPDDNSHVYFISDNGVGFDMKYAGKLFGVFQRLHSVTEFEGNGVGLAIVQRIISRHNGRVWSEAEPNNGAVFFISLPF